MYAAALDISKAYDRLSHVRLFTSLLRTGMPRWVVYLLVDWYSKLQVAVRWMDSLSAYFKVGSGLRQGSSLSPALFNVYINVVVLRLRMLDLRPLRTSRIYGPYTRVTKNAPVYTARIYGPYTTPVHSHNSLQRIYAMNNVIFNSLVQRCVYYMQYA